MKLTDNCYAVTGLYYIVPWNVNAGFIVGKKKTLVVDSGSNAVSAQTVYGYASAARAGNEIVLINTEKHLDHIGGNGYFSGRGVPIYGHQSIDRKQKEFDQTVDEFNALISDVARRKNREERAAFQDTKIVNPNITINKEMEMDLGGIAVEVLLTPGHTGSNLSVYVPADRVLYCGDCIVPDMLPNLEEGNVPEWRTWLDSLDRIGRLEIEALVPGHGNVVLGQDKVNTVTERMREFLHRAIGTGKAPTGNETL